MPASPPIESPHARAETERAAVLARRWRWIADRWFVLAAAAITLPVAVLSIVGTLYWPGRPFPGFFVLGNTIVPTIRVYDWTGGTVPFYSRVVEVDGRPVTTNRGVYDYVAGQPIGTTVSYTLEKGNDRFTRAVSSMRFTATHYWLTVGLFVIFGVLALTGGIAVALLQPHTRAARAFLVQGIFGGLFALTATALYQPDLWWLSRPQLATQALFAAAMIHLGLVFPETRPLVTRRPWVIAAPYTFAGLLTAWMMVDFYRVPPGLTAYHATSLYFAFAIVALIALLVFAYWENRTPLVRARLHAVLPGVVLGTGLALYGFLNLARPESDFPINLIALAGPLFYLSIGYAIVKHDLFDIDALVKQAAVYATLTLAVTATYAASIVALGVLLPTAAESRIASSFTLTFIIVVAIFFQPLRTRAQDLVDRTFYRRRLDYRRTVSELSAALTSLLDREEILDRIGRTVTEGLQLRSFAVVLWLDEHATLWSYDERRGGMEPRAEQRFTALRGELERAPGEPWQPTRPGPSANPESDAPAAQQEAALLDAALVLPLAIHGETIGAFALGPRRSGRPFNREDIELLTTLAAQSAVAVQNAHSYRQLQALNDALEDKVRIRTAELEASNTDLGRAYEELQTTQAQLLTTEKMASLGLIVAGVAHEINNPLSFIIGNVDPVHQTLARVRALAATHRDPELTADVERLGKILDLMALGAERTATIVQDLRTFSRLGEEEPRPTDLHEAIEVSLRLLRPRWADRITIHRDYGTLGPVDVIPGQINQVFMNLLANACDAIRGRGNLWIRTTRDDRQIVITIRDDGTGIAPEHLNRVFDPFFTTKAVGQGTGLGLAITQGIVTQHGGVIRVATEPGKGTEFQVILPVGGQRSATAPRQAGGGQGA